jgi:hypothetical protein
MSGARRKEVGIPPKQIQYGERQLRRWEGAHLQDGDEERQTRILAD